MNSISRINLAAGSVSALPQTPKKQSSRPPDDVVSLGNGITPESLGNPAQGLDLMGKIPANLILPHKNHGKFASKVLKGLFVAGATAYLGGCAAFAVIPNLYNKKTTPTFNQEQINDIKKHLKPGDIVLTQSNHHQTFYYLLHSTFGHQYSHAATFVGDNSVIDSYDQPDKQDIDVFFKRMTNIAVLRPKYDNQGQIDRSIKYLESQIGKNYDMKFDLTDDSEHYCSELTMRGLDASGINAKVPGHKILNQPMVLPDDFFKADKIELVKEFSSIK